MGKKRLWLYRLTICNCKLLSSNKDVHAVAQNYKLLSSNKDVYAVTAQNCKLLSQQLLINKEVNGEEKMTFNPLK